MSELGGVGLWSGLGFSPGQWWEAYKGSVGAADISCQKQEGADTLQSLKTAHLFSFPIPFLLYH